MKKTARAEPVHEPFRDVISRLGYRIEAPLWGWPIDTETRPKQTPLVGLHLVPKNVTAAPRYILAKALQAHPDAPESLHATTLQGNHGVVVEWNAAQTITRPHFRQLLKLAETRVKGETLTATRTRRAQLDGWKDAPKDAHTWRDLEALATRLHRLGWHAMESPTTKYHGMREISTLNLHATGGKAATAERVREAIHRHFRKYGFEPETHYRIEGSPDGLTLLGRSVRLNKHKVGLYDFLNFLRWND